MRRIQAKNNSSASYTHSHCSLNIGLHKQQVVKDVVVVVRAPAD